MRKDCTKTVGWKNAGKRALETIRDQTETRVQEYNKTPKHCKHCQKDLSYEKRHNIFCSRSCSATFTDTRIGRRHGKAPETRNCLNCLKEFTYYFSKKSSKGKFCSTVCGPAYTSRKNKERWLSGKMFGMSRNTLRRYLIEERGNKCEIEGCSVGSEWLGKPIVLTVDHIDGNAGDHRPQNVRLICANCHSQTDTFTSRNKGNGRGARGLSLG